MSDRQEVGALDEFRIGPIKTTIPLHRRIMDTREFITAGSGGADFDIHYIERMLKNDRLQRRALPWRELNSKRL